MQHVTVNYRDLELVKVQRRSDVACSGLDGIYMTQSFPDQGSENIIEEGKERFQEPEVWDDCFKIISSGHGRVIHS